MQDLFSLKGQTAVVIGGTGVLGGAMAGALASAGARIAVLGRSAERGEERIRDIRDNGSEAFFQAADALSRDSLQTARDAILQQTGSIEILVNAAGGNHPSATLPPGKDFPNSRWKAGSKFLISTWSAARCCRARCSEKPC
jgi:NAD(P)-dependent dehydrogenase (short-subunit alcohol dehydrogenase family)